MIARSGVLPAIFGALLLAGCAGARPTTLPANFEKMGWSEEHRGDPLDLSGYRETFVETFDDLQLSDAKGDARWKAPVHTDMGLGKLQAPGSPVYSVADGKLVLRTVKTPEGKWLTANMQTLGSLGQGFAQRRGYFEMRAKLPRTRGVWGGFWLLSKNQYTDPTLTRSEIDIVEWYGLGDDANHHSAIHLWPARRLGPKATVKKHLARSKISKIPAMDDQFHSYGVLLTNQWVIVYMDRSELKRFRLLPEQDTLMYILLSLFMNPRAKIHEPSSMEVDEVRAWARR